MQRARVIGVSWREQAIEEDAIKALVVTDGSRDANDAVEWLAHFPLPSDATMKAALRDHEAERCREFSTVAERDR
jgi:hypothetical protein